MENSGPSQKKKWYDKGFIIFLLCLFFFPLGLYGLWKSNNFSKTTKFVVTFFVVASVFWVMEDKKGNNVGSHNSYTTAPSYLSSSEGSASDVRYARIGDELNIEHFTYRVNKMYYKKTIGNEFTKKTADGVFLIINLSLKNNDNEAHTIDNSLFKLTDQSGTQYESSNDGSIALQMSGQETLFLKQCNPKIQKQGLLIFEVPSEGQYDIHLTGGFWTGKTGVVKLYDI
jgi:hypothetical protein